MFIIAENQIVDPVASMVVPSVQLSVSPFSKKYVYFILCNVKRPHQNVEGQMFNQRNLESLSIYR